MYKYANVHVLCTQYIVQCTCTMQQLALQLQLYLVWYRHTYTYDVLCTMYYVHRTRTQYLVELRCTQYIGTRYKYTCMYIVHMYIVALHSTGRLSVQGTSTMYMQTTQYILRCTRVHSSSTRATLYHALDILCTLCSYKVGLLCTQYKVQGTSTQQSYIVQTRAMHGVSNGSVDTRAPPPLLLYNIVLCTMYYVYRTILYMQRATYVHSVYFVQLYYKVCTMYDVRCTYSSSIYTQTLYVHRTRYLVHSRGQQLPLCMHVCTYCGTGMYIVQGTSYKVHRTQYKMLNKSEHQQIRLDSLDYSQTRLDQLYRSVNYYIVQVHSTSYKVPRTSYKVHRTMYVLLVHSRATCTR